MNDVHATYLWPGATRFGFGVVNAVAEEAALLGATRAFVLADPGVIAAGLLEPVTSSLEKAGLPFTVYDQIVPNPDVASVDAAGAACKGAGADLILAVGGGSAIDTAKGARLLAGNPGMVSIAAYSLRLGEKSHPLPHAHQLPRMIAIPTTAGTGAEVTPWGVITDVSKKQKFGIGDRSTIPSVALVDPELTLTLPANLTAATGMDALSHLIEAYVSTNRAPILDPMILYGIELLNNSLRMVVARPADLQGRHDMMLASLIGGIAISTKWLGACHSLAHPLSSVADVPHGIACAIMLPHQMEYSLSGALERYARIAEIFNQGGILTGSMRHRAFQAVEWVRELIVDIGIPLQLRAVGVTKAIMPELAKMAYEDLNWWTNPRDVNESVMENLYHKAF